MKEPYLAHSDLTGEIYVIVGKDKYIVTEQAKKAVKAVEQKQRKGHWVLTDIEGDKVWHCNCSECGKDPQDYVGGSENWWLIKSKLPKFCPSCGSYNDRHMTYKL